MCACGGFVTGSMGMRFQGLGLPLVRKGGKPGVPSAADAALVLSPAPNAILGTFLAHILRFETSRGGSYRMRAVSLFHRSPSPPYMTAVGMEGGRSWLELKVAAVRTQATIIVEGKGREGKEFSADFCPYLWPTRVDVWGSLRRGQGLVLGPSTWGAHCGRRSRLVP